MNWRSRAMAVFPDDVEMLSEGLPGYLRSLTGDVDVEAIVAAARPLALARVSPGGHGFSLNDLLESHALLLEARIYGSGDHSPEQFVEFLDKECPSSQYRRVYDLFRLWCGDHIAYATFHAAVIGSLCTPRPLERFGELLVDCSRLDATDVDGFLRAMALQWDGALARIQLSSPGHQEIQVYVDSFLDWSSDLSVTEMIRSPECLLSFPYHPPVVYAGDESGRFALLQGLRLPEYMVDLEEDMREVALVYEYTTAAISYWLLSECVRSEELTPLTTVQHGWLERLVPKDLALYILVDNWGAARGEDPALVEEAILRDGERLLRTISEIGGEKADRLCLPALRRLRLIFVTESDLEVWQIPEVRKFIQLVASRAAWVPMLLRYSKPETLFLVWFGSLVPESVSGLSIDMSHPGVKLELWKFMTSVEHASGGLDLTPCVKATLYPLTG